MNQLYTEYAVTPQARDLYFTNKPLLIEKLGVKISKLDKKSEKTERVNRRKTTQN